MRCLFGEFCSGSHFSKIGCSMPHPQQFVPYYVKFYDPAGTQQDAYLLNQLELTSKILQKDEYSMVENQPNYTNRYAWHAYVDWMGSVA